MTKPTPAWLPLAYRAQRKHLVKDIARTRKHLAELEHELAAIDKALAKADAPAPKASSRKTGRAPVVRETAPAVLSEPSDERAVVTVCADRPIAPETKAAIVGMACAALAVVEQLPPSAAPVPPARPIAATPAAKRKPRSKPQYPAPMTLQGAPPAIRRAAPEYLNGQMPVRPVVIETPKTMIASAAPAFTETERRALAMKRMLVKARAKQLPAPTRDELSAIVAASNVPIKKLPPGAHAGWRPPWME